MKQTWAPTAVPQRQEPSATVCQRLRPEFLQKYHSGSEHKRWRTPWEGMCVSREVAITHAQAPRNCRSKYREVLSQNGYGGGGGGGCGSDGAVTTQCLSITPHACGGGGGGGSDGAVTTMCLIISPHACTINSGDRTPGNKLPASPPPLPRPDGGGTPGRVPVYTALKRPSHHTMKCNCGNLRSFLHVWTP